MKKRLIVVVVTIVLLAIFGAVLQNPPGIDALAGATRRSRPVVETPDEPAYYYVGVAPGCPVTAEGITTIATREGGPLSLTLAIAADDDGLLEQAQLLQEQAKQGGVTLTIQAYSEVMLYSRAYYGKYDLLLVKTNEPSAPDMYGADVVLFHREDA